MSNETGGQAFPCEPAKAGIDDQTGLGIYRHQGMTLRDYFAAKAMQSAYLHFSANADVAAHWTTEGVAASAYAMADAMIFARNAKE